MLALKCDDNEYYTFHRVYRSNGDTNIIRCPASAHSCSSFLASQNDWDYSLIVEATAEDVEAWLKANDGVAIVGLFKI